MRNRVGKTESGFTSIGLIVTLAIIAIPAGGAAQPDRKTVKFWKEIELRQNLREIRKAVDNYYYACNQGLIGPLDRKIDDECYPPNLEILVKGVHPPNRPDNIIRFLRRIPRDPLTGKAEWGVRSVQDEPNSTSWGGQNVFDVYSLSMETALDGTKYKDW
jgi:general secretion pathway protein G